MKLYLLAISLFFVQFTAAQHPYIHAESVGEWKTSEDLSPEYHYNSVGVFLLNEDKLLSLFDPSNFTREERKRTGIRSFDNVESLYFQLEIPNPQKEEEVLSFPLYTFDLKPTNHLKSPRNQGKILDRITDEELNGRGLDAVARIEMVNKNELLEVAYKISSTINRVLGNGIFEKPDIWQVMQKAQHFFESRYRGEMVAEFSIPILPEDEAYEYVIQSASLYQIKWNFQEKASIYKNNVWSGLQTSAATEAHLVDKPTRLSKLKKHPFLLVIRYKSAYALPKEQQLNVSLTPEYLDKRLYNLQEFRNESIAYKAEAYFIQLLRTAIEVCKNIEEYISAKEKGTINNQMSLSIAQDYYYLLSEYKNYKAQLAGEAATYHREYYKVTYFKFFKQLEHFLFKDPQIKAISQTPKALLKWQELKEDSLSSVDLYDFLEIFQPYREVLTNEQPPKGNLSFLLKEQATVIEKALFDTITTELPYTQGEKIAYYQKIEQQYPLCQYCKEQATAQVEQLSNRMLEEIRSSLLTLQNQQLMYGRCFTDLQKKAYDELKRQFPDSSTLEPSELMLYEVLEGKIQSMEKIMEDFLSISTLPLQEMTFQEVEVELKKYKGLIHTYQQHICNLSHGGILSKEEVQCFAKDCQSEMP